MQKWTWASIALLVTGILILVAAGDPGKPNPDKETAQIKAIMESLKMLHYQPQELTDDFSKKVFENYLSTVDGNKRFLTASEYAQLSRYETLLDDQIKSASFEFFEQARGLVSHGIQRVDLWYKEILSTPVDLEQKEQLEFSAEKLNHAADEAQLKDRWRKLLTYEVIDRINDKLDEQEKSEQQKENANAEKVTKKSIPELEIEAREYIKGRYDDWMKRINKNTRVNYLGEYFDAICGVHDPHTNFWLPVEKQNFDIGMSGRLEGIGARLQTEKEYTKVDEVIVGGPAWKQKDLQNGDLILKVAQDGKEAEDIINMNLDEVVKRIRGPKGTKVTLTVRKADGSSREITIVRDEVIFDEGFAHSVIISEPGRMDKIGLINLPKFYADFETPNGRSCAEDVKQELIKLKSQGVRGIILDLRNNGGGALRDVVRMSGFFIEEGPIVQVKSPNRDPDPNLDTDPSVLWDGPLVIMVNEFSASASEIIAAAMQDYQRAIIVGSKTHGKGTVQRFFDLDNFQSDPALRPMGNVKISIQKFFRVTGSSTQRKGVTPDIELPDAYMYIERGEEENKYALPWTEISATKFNQNVYVINNPAQYQQASKTRIAKSDGFAKIQKNAERLKRNKEETSYPLSLTAFRQLDKDRKAEYEQYKEVFPSNEKLVIENIPADLITIQSDSVKIARNSEFMKSIKKDIYLDETFNILADMIRNDQKIAQKKK